MSVLISGAWHTVVTQQIFVARAGPGSNISTKGRHDEEMRGVGLGDSLPTFPLQQIPSCLRSPASPSSSSSAFSAGGWTAE